MLYPLIVAVMLVCAIQAVRSTRLLASAIWLAATSALVALLIYLLGAPEVAVIELSVGAGLVTVLFVFAINIAGEEAPLTQSPLPKPLIWTVLLIAVVLLGRLILPSLNLALPAPLQQVCQRLWNNRNLDHTAAIGLDPGRWCWAFFVCYPKNPTTKAEEKKP